MKKECFNKDWWFSLGETGTAQGPWKKVELPHDFMIEQPRDKDSHTCSSGGYFPGGFGWYLKKFDAPAEWHDKDVYVEFEGIYMNAEIRLNGNVITRQNYGYTTFMVNLAPYMKFGEENEMYVLVDNTKVPNSRWYSGSGIYRYAWIYVAEKTHIGHWGVYVTTPEISKTCATVKIETAIEGPIVGNMRIEHTIYDKDEKIVWTNDPVFPWNDTHKGKIDAPLIWDIDSPYLYTLETRLYNGDVCIDTETTTFGIRSFSVGASDGFVLNGRPLKLKGGCVHHDNGILGAASYKRSEERKIELLKASGFNAVRCAHNPPAPAFLEACDRLGMLVMDEAFDQWRVRKTQYDYHIDFDRDWNHDITNMVLRDRNHPAVVFWSIGNEIYDVYDNSSNAAETSRMLAKRVRELDSRPVTAGLIGFEGKCDAGRNTPETVAPLDFIGYNYTYELYADLHKIYPDKAICATETFPQAAYDTWEAAVKNPYVIGDFVWTAIDYLGEAGLGRVYHKDERPEIEWHTRDYPWNQAYCGDIDVCGFKRPQSYYRDILWHVSEKPKMFVRRPSHYSKESERITRWGWQDGIEGWDFDGWEGKSMIVDVYSPAASVSLYLNGVLVETKELAKLKAEFDVMYAPGILKAVDSNNNEAVLSTSKGAHKIKLTPDKKMIGSNADLCYVTVEVADEDGKIVTNAANKITFAVTGSGALLAVGAPNPKTEEMYVGATHGAYDGKMMAVVKSCSAGNITLHAFSSGLIHGEVSIAAI